jgi:hypothetical protein
MSCLRAPPRAMLRALAEQIGVLFWTELLVLARPGTNSRGARWNTRVLPEKELIRSGLGFARC